MSSESFDVPNWEEIRTKINTAGDVDPQLVALDFADRYDLFTLITIRERVSAELAGRTDQTVISVVLGDPDAFGILQIAIALKGLGRRYRESGRDILEGEP